MATPDSKVIGRKIKDLTGERYGRLTVTGFSHRVKSGHSFFCCECDCGAATTVRKDALVNGKTTSCGCKSADSSRERFTKHGMNQTAEYRAWQQMKERCNNPRKPRFADYGGRGIRVCERWSGQHGFANFIADMGRKPHPDLSIERINNDGNYEPGNCKWATRIEQRNNQRKAKPKKPIVYQGESKTLSDWAKHFGLTYAIVLHRLHSGWDLDDVFGPRIRQRKSRTH